MTRNKILKIVWGKEHLEFHIPRLYFSTEDFCGGFAGSRDYSHPSVWSLLLCTKSSIVYFDISWTCWVRTVDQNTGPCGNALRDTRMETEMQLVCNSDRTYSTPSQKFVWTVENSWVFSAVNQSLLWTYDQGMFLLGMMSETDLSARDFSYPDKRSGQYLSAALPRGWKKTCIFLAHCSLFQEIWG